MNQISEELISGDVGNSPLQAYPWSNEAVRLIQWSKNKNPTYRAFVFDLLMSLAYIDTIPFIQKYIERQEVIHYEYNAHLGFVNICTPCLLEHNKWVYQKAAKPQSGAIGKLTSEIILKCIELYFGEFEIVKSLGGVGSVDAVLVHSDGRILLCEIKASPLTTFPFLFKIPSSLGDPNKLTRTQIEMIDSALYMHCDHITPLGKPGDSLWPFKAGADFITEDANHTIVDEIISKWNDIRKAYKEKDKKSLLYYVANASGHPPRIAKDQFEWPPNESISDSKTSAGLDRTDDIKKGVYQTFKLSIESSKAFPKHNIKTAIISNLPAYRHGVEYLEPFYDIYWAHQASFEEEPNKRYVCSKNDLKRPFDYIIALEDAFTRGELF